MELIKIKEQQSGFSLTQLMIALGISGVIGFIIIKQYQTVDTIHKKANVNQDLNLVTSSIQQTLLNNESCTETIKSVRAGTDEIRKVYYKNGVKEIQTIFKKNDFANNDPSQSNFSSRTGFQIKEMEVVDSDTPLLRVYFQSGRMEQGVFKPDKIEYRRDFLFRQEGEECYSELPQEEIIKEQASMIACKSMKGLWNASEKRCELINLPHCFIHEGQQSACGLTGEYKDAGRFRIMENATTMIKMYRCCREPIPPLPVASPPPTDDEGGFDDPDSVPACDPEDWLIVDGDEITCKPEPEEPAACADITPPTDPVTYESSSYSAYGAWSFCTATTPPGGQGTQSRKRLCGANCDCSGDGQLGPAEDVETRTCVRSIPAGED